MQDEINQAAIGRGFLPGGQADGQAAALGAGRAAQQENFLEGFADKLSGRLSHFDSMISELRNLNDRHLMRTPSELKNEKTEAPTPDITTAHLTNSLRYFDELIVRLENEINRYREL